LQSEHVFAAERMTAASGCRCVSCKHFSPLLTDAGEPAEMHTVFQIAGPETPGLLAEITELLSHNGLEIRTAAVSARCPLSKEAEQPLHSLLLKPPVS
jgi:UTP:GlnB (protein PII) uridylyltransferase